MAAFLPPAPAGGIFPSFPVSPRLLLYHSVTLWCQLGQLPLTKTGRCGHRKRDDVGIVPYGFTKNSFPFLLYVTFFKNYGPGFLRARFFMCLCLSLCPPALNAQRMAGGSFGADSPKDLLPVPAARVCRDPDPADKPCEHKREQQIDDGSGDQREKGLIGA